MKKIILFLMLLFPLSVQAQPDFEHWIAQEIENIKKVETDSTLLKIKLRPLVHAQEFFEKIEEAQNNIVVEPIGDFMYTEITEKFQGNYAAGAQLYWDITVGKKEPNLFIESGAGRFEKISDIHETALGVEFTTDRIYKSGLAFNTRTTTRLRQFVVPQKNRVVIVNELVKDWGKGLSQKKVKKFSKPYGPVYFDLIIDVYQKIDTEHFVYKSWAAYKGQGMKSTNSSLNVAKSVGNIFSLGALDRGLESKIKSVAKDIWTKRKELFQAAILKEH